ncbi:MAG: Nickel-transporting ATPase [Ilumatobacteraceae bacterium]|nr:Nickel-transporting ATPase [Ilumatobacteraceae bacterium]
MTLLEVSDLTVRIGETTVVDGVSFTIDGGERVGIIGESGSGKTLTALSIIGLAPDEAQITGSILLDGQELLGRSDRDLAVLRGDRVAMVFQNPLTSLNPVMKIGRQIAEPLRLHRGIGRNDAAAAALELCKRVGLPDPERAVNAYPHQLSGGQRQRVGIAIALACRPALLIADEPTTALDVTVQAEVLALLDALIVDQGTALLFITHDIALISQVARRLLVMRHGAIVERGDVADLIDRPEDPYTAALVTAARRTTLDDTDELVPSAAAGVAQPGREGVVRPGTDPGTAVPPDAHIDAEPGVGPAPREVDRGTAH